MKRIGLFPGLFLCLLTATAVSLAAARQPAPAPRQNRPKMASFPMPSPHSGVRNMTRDADGRIWMALSGADKVAVVE